MVSLLLVLCFLHGVSAALNPIVVKGTKLYDSVTKERFMMRGLAYAPDKYFNPKAGGDPSLVDRKEDLLDDAHEAWWSRDIQFLQDLNVNVVRIYEIDPFKPHGKIMKALDDAGIYVIVGLTKSAPDVALPAGTPSPGCFRASMMDSVERIITNMAIYPNLMAFVVGNEVANSVQIDGTTTSARGYLAIPCVKSLARDARKFMRNCPSLRSVPLMYAATDFLERKVVADYLSCNQTEDGGAVDFYGINVYTWCATGSTVNAQSSYGVLVNEFKSYNIPVIFSEYGCNQGSFYSTFNNSWANPRTWKSAGKDGLFSSAMIDVVSGGIAYQYSMTANDYGLVLLPGYQANQPNIVALANYYNLQAKYFEDIGVQAARADFGTWTEANECTWVPPATGRFVPQCPSLADVNKTFVAGGINTAIYPPTIWYEPLPELSRTSLPCAVGSGPIPTKCEHLPPSPPTPAPPTSAPTPGNCEAIQKLPGCAVNLTSLSGSEVGNIFDRICGVKFSNYAPDPSWCRNVFEGSHQSCTAQQKIDYALFVWAGWASECCVSLADAFTCNPYSEPNTTAPSSEPTPSTSVAPSAAPNSAPTAPTGNVSSPTSAGVPTAAVSAAPSTKSNPTPVVKNPTPKTPTAKTGEQQAVADEGSGSGLAIGVSVSVILILVALAVAFFLYRRAKVRRSNEASTMLAPLMDTSVQ